MRSLLILLLLGSPCLGVEIPDGARVKNPGSYCMWACLDCLGKTHEIWGLDGVLAEQVREYPDGFPGYSELVCGKLKSLGVSYAYQKRGSKQTDLLDAHAAQWGVVVAIGQGNPHSIGCHAIVITSWGKDKATFWDPNKPNHIYVCGRPWLEHWMTGEQVVVMKELK